jgi:beta-glucosidase-like glycosyl hydrolase
VRFRRSQDVGRTHTHQASAEASLELARSLLRTGRTEEARATRIEFAGEVPPAAVAFASAIRGLVADDVGEAISSLRDAAGRLEALGKNVDLARCLLDLGRAQQRLGEDPRAAFERARELLAECDARWFLPEAEELLAGVDR